MQKKIDPSDYLVLAKIFNQNSNKVFILRAEGAIDLPDLYDCSVLFFNTKIELLQAIEYEKKGTIINETPLHFEDFFCQKYPAIVLLNLRRPKIKARAKKFNTFFNPDETIRCLYSNELRKPIFLNLYTPPSWKGKLFKKLFILCYKLQIQWLINDTSIWVEAHQLSLDSISKELNNAPYAIFISAIRAHRKAIICYKQKGQSTQFLKIPLTKASQNSIQNERQQLKRLQQQNFKYLVHPTLKSIDNISLLSNIRPTKCLAVQHLNNTHFLALKEIYKATTTIQPLSTLSTWKHILNDLSVIRNNPVKNNIPVNQVHHLANLLEQLSESIAHNQPISVALAHGDFTPRKTYVTSQAVHAYDWELAKQLPLLYDCFHYLFQTTVLTNKENYQSLKIALKDLEQNEIIQSIITEYQFDFNRAYQFYLLHNTSHYLSRYISQSHLDETAHSLIKMWTEALESSLKTSPSFVLPKT